MRLHGHASTWTAVALAAACADPLTVSDRQPGLEPAADYTLGTEGGVNAAVGAIGAITLQYVCRNTFEVVNGWQVPAALYWRTDNGGASGHLEIPHQGEASFDATARSLNRTVELFSDAARTKRVATVVHGNRTCKEQASGNLTAFLSFGAACGSTLTLTNSGPKIMRVNWRDLGSRREGSISVPPASPKRAPKVLSFDVGTASAVQATFGTLSLGTITPATGTACREGAVLTWDPLGVASVNGNAIHSTYAERLDALFVGDGPDYGAGRVWTVNLSTEQTTELPSFDYPQGKFRKLIYDESNNRLVTFWDGLGQSYALPISGGSWTAVGSSANSDMYYEGAGFWNPVDGSITSWGGYGLGAFRNSFWTLDASGGTWSQIVPTGTEPWGRISPRIAVDRVGKRLFVTSGEGSIDGTQWHPTQQLLADLWSLDLVTQQWTNLIPVGVGTAAAGGPIAHVGGENALYRFGGVSDGAFSDLLSRVDLTAGVSAFTPVHVYGVRPSPRASYGLHYDSRRHRLLLVSGFGANGWTNDIWELRLP